MASPASSNPVCPACGKQGRKVAGATLDHHLGPTHRAKLGEAAGFCPNQRCPVVYFSGTTTILKGETLLPVTQKDPGDDVPVCYCFNFKRGDIRRDLTKRGTTDIPERIEKGIAEGLCACERKNPQGACCLGNVASAVKKIKNELSPDGRLS